MERISSRMARASSVLPVVARRSASASSVCARSYGAAQASASARASSRCAAASAVRPDRRLDLAEEAVRVQQCQRLAGSVARASARSARWRASRSPRPGDGIAPRGGGLRPGRARRRSRPANGRALTARHGRPAGRPRRAPARRPHAAGRGWTGTISRPAPFAGHPAVPRAPAPRPAPADPGGEPTDPRSPTTYCHNGPDAWRGSLPPMPGLRSRHLRAARGAGGSRCATGGAARRLRALLPSAPGPPRSRPASAAARPDRVVR